VCSRVLENERFIQYNKATDRRKARTGYSSVTQKLEPKILKGREKLDRWVEHFSEVLNSGHPTNPIEPHDTKQVEELGEIDCGVISAAEVKLAIKITKRRKATGSDSVSVDLLRADERTTKQLTEIFNKVWEDEKIPYNWKKGLSVYIAKKGDLADCNNWRGVTLLPVMSKIFRRVLIKKAFDSVNRQGLWKILKM
jgi:hypothetical protein